MAGKFVIAILAMAWLGSLAAADISIGAGGQAGVYLAQETASPPRTGQSPRGAAGPPARDEAPPDQTGKDTPAAPPKGDPLKPFEPTEKVKADQAIDFPADI